jgi:hypothetical protein
VRVAVVSPSAASTDKKRPFSVPKVAYTAGV